MQRILQNSIVAHLSFLFSICGKIPNGQRNGADLFSEDGTTATVVGDAVISPRIASEGNHENTHSAEFDSLPANTSSDVCGAFLCTPR